MLLSEKLMELIHEYKLVSIQATVHLANSRMDMYIDCLDMMSKIKDDIEKEKKRLEWLELHYIMLN